MKYPEINPQDKRNNSVFIQNLKKAGIDLLNENVSTPVLNTKIKAKTAIAAGDFVKIGFDAYEQTVGDDVGSVWYLTTDSSGERWLVKDLDENGNIIRHLVAAELNNMNTENIMDKDIDAVLGMVDNYGYENLDDKYKTMYDEFKLKSASIKTAAPNDFVMPYVPNEVDDNMKPMEWVTDSKNDEELSEEESEEENISKNSDERLAEDSVDKELGTDEDVDIKINPDDLTAFIDFPETNSTADGQALGQKPINENTEELPEDLQDIEPVFNPNDEIEEKKRPSQQENPSPEVF